MEILNHMLTGINDFFLVIATAAGALLVILRGIFAKLMIGLLGGLGRGAGTGLGSKLTGPGGGGQPGGSGMPTSPRYKQAKTALYQAAARQTRMANYINAWFNLLSMRTGPHAVSVYLYSLMHPHFKDKIARLRIRCREFDRLEEKAQKVLSRYERDFERQCVPLRNLLIHHDVELFRWKARYARFGFQLWKRRYWYHRRKIRQTRWKMIALQIKLYFRTRRLNIVYRPFVEPAFREMDHYERIYLASWVHSFEADLESFRLTVISGRLIEEVLSENFADFRDFYQLSELPVEAEALRHFLRQYLTERNIGFASSAAIEGLFETWLRVRLLEDERMRKKWNISTIWLTRCIPAPGAIGIAQAQFGHLPHNTVWLPDDFKIQGGDVSTLHPYVGAVGKTPNGHDGHGGDRRHEFVKSLPES